MIRRSPVASRLAPLARLALLVSTRLFWACGTPGSTCKEASDCPDPGPCATAVCTGGLCEPEPRRFGFPVPDDDEGDCVRLICDGLGGLSAELLKAGTLVGDDHEGDCRAQICDSAGRALLSAYDRDTPEDGNACTIGACLDGEPVQRPAPAGKKAGDTKPGDCSSPRCDGRGQAVPAPDPLDGADDGNPCTLDRCENGQTVHVPMPEGLTVQDTPGDCRGLRCDGKGGGTPVPLDSDSPELSAPCLVGTCSAGLPGASQAAVGASCDELGSRCRPSGLCSLCPDPGPTCEDTGAGEPNDSETTAHDLGSAAGLAGKPAAVVCGVLGGADEVDWYRLRVPRGAGGPPGPDFGPAPGLSVCVFFACEPPPATLTCPAGTTVAVSPSGRRGCCGNAPFRVQPRCGGSRAGLDPDVLVRVRLDEGAACTPYALRVHD